jgi:hypothetical protein
MMGISVSATPPNRILMDNSILPASHCATGVVLEMTRVEA